MTAQHLANKFRRAIRNDTGTHFTADELRQLGEWGVMDILLQQEAEELSVKWAGRKSGSTPSGHSKPKKIASVYWNPAALDWRRPADRALRFA